MSELQTTTVTLSQALKSSSVRGRGAVAVVELAGMERRVAFDEQVSGDSGRPDMVVYLPGGGELPVDAKTPMTAYLNAAEAGDDATYKNYMRAHAQAVRGRVRELGQKAYWSQFEKAPEFVVMFVPVEASVAAAFEEEPSLLDDARYDLDENGAIGFSDSVIFANAFGLSAVTGTAQAGKETSSMGE